MLFPAPASSLMTLAGAGKRHTAALVSDILWVAVPSRVYALMGIRMAPRTVGVFAAALARLLPRFADLGVDSGSSAAAASLLVLVEFVTSLAKALLFQLNGDRSVQPSVGLVRVRLLKTIVVRHVLLEQRVVTDLSVKQ